jgi:hypothetical protein
VPRWKKNGDQSRRCVATAHKTGRQCEWSALPGKDRCAWHGGGAVVLTGRYSRYLGRTLASAMESMDGETDLTEELRLARTLLGRTLELMQALSEKPLLEMACCREAARLVADVRDVARAVDEQQQRRSITPEQVALVVSNILRVLTKYVGSDVLEAVSRDMRETKWPGGVACLPHREALGECASGS